ncbi:MAG TPA: UPF0182 family protein [Mycobacteriales bacterium]|jgi:hypothetical protein
MPTPTLSRRARIILAVVVGLIVLVILIGVFSSLYVDWLWFGSVHHQEIFTGVLGTRVMLFFLFGLVMALIVGVNLIIGYRSRPPFRPMSAEQQSLERYRTVIEPRRGKILAAIAVVLVLFTGLAAQGRWQTWLLWQNGTSFGIKDPQFHKDLSYYAFTYPFQRFIVGFLFIAFLLSLIGAVIVHYLFGGLRIQSPGEKATPAARAHLSVLLGGLVALKVVSYYLDRYGLMFSNRGGITGASYTDINAVLPAKTILLSVALICAIAFVANVFFRNFALPAIALVLLVLSSVLIGGAYPAIVQQFQVKPNANEKEKPYIERNIQATRSAYGIANVNYSSYNATTDITPVEEQKIKANTGTIPNARLLDPNILAPTFDQRQRILNYYSFNDKLDIDRYTIGGKTQDYVVGARELDPTKLTGNQTNWINEHLVYTHGNGFVAAPANQAPGGLPNFTTGDLPTTGNIKVTQPDIYYGELFGQDYAIVGKSSKQGNVEFDRPGPNGTDIKNTYAGGGGVKLGGVVNRLAFAIKYRERNMLLSSRISSDSRILFNRDPRQIVQKVAPFLKVDGDPYPSVINGRITWIVDGYTTSDGYPYAERETLGDVTKDSLTGRGTSGQPNQEVNYIRNSVKATVDAYSGKVTLYDFNNSDPVLKTWMKVFPDLIKPTSAISPELRSHFRYPEDLFKVQRKLIASYHVSDPVQFFNSQGFWDVPSDPTQPGLQSQPPYYLLAQNPGETAPRFQLTSVLSALKRPNMAAYVSVSSDPQDYGKIRVLELPNDTSVSGPVQVQSQLRSTSVISRDISLFDQGGSNVLYGNLLTLPVANGLLYVEPLYVEGQGTNYPQLREVMVLFGSNVGYASNLPDALQNLFTGQNVSATGGSGTQPPPTTTAPTTPPASSPPPATGTSPPGSTSPGVAAAAAAVKTAYAHLQAAFNSNDLKAYSKAQAELSQAITNLQRASKTAPTPTPTR